MFPSISNGYMVSGGRENGAVEDPKKKGAKSSGSSSGRGSMSSGKTDDISLPKIHQGADVVFMTELEPVPSSVEMAVTDATRKRKQNNVMTESFEEHKINESEEDLSKISDDTIVTQMQRLTPVKKIRFEEDRGQTSDNTAKKSKNPKKSILKEDASKKVVTASDMATATLSKDKKDIDTDSKRRNEEVPEKMRKRHDDQTYRILFGAGDRHREEKVVHDPKPRHSGVFSIPSHRVPFSSMDTKMYLFTDVNLRKERKAEVTPKAEEETKFLSSYDVKAYQKHLYEDLKRRRAAKEQKQQKEPVTAQYSGAADPKRTQVRKGPSQKASELLKTLNKKQATKSYMCSSFAVLAVPPNPKKIAEESEKGRKDPRRTLPNVQTRDKVSRYDYYDYRRHGNRTQGRGRKAERIKSLPARKEIPMVPSLPRNVTSAPSKDPYGRDVPLPKVNTLMGRDRYDGYAGTTTQRQDRAKQRNLYRTNFFEALWLTDELGNEEESRPKKKPPIKSVESKETKEKPPKPPEVQKPPAPEKRPRSPTTTVPKSTKSKTNEKEKTGNASFSYYASTNSKSPRSQVQEASRSFEEEMKKEAEVRRQSVRESAANQSPRDDSEEEWGLPHEPRRRIRFIDPKEEEYKMLRKEGIDPETLKEMTFQPKVNVSRKVVKTYTGTETSKEAILTAKENRQNPKTKNGSVYKVVENTVPYERKNYMLNKRESNMYFQMNRIYGSTSYKKQRQNYFFDKLMDMQVDDYYFKVMVQEEKERRRRLAKIRQSEQLKEVRQRFEEDAWKRFMSQYVTSRILAHEHMDRSVYGLPEKVGAEPEFESKLRRKSIVPKEEVIIKPKKKKYKNIFDVKMGPTWDSREPPPKMEGFDTVDMDTDDESADSKDGVEPADENERKRIARRQNVKTILKEAKTLLQEAEKDLDAIKFEEDEHIPKVKFETPRKPPHREDRDKENKPTRTGTGERLERHHEQPSRSRHRDEVRKTDDHSPRSKLPADYTSLYGKSAIVGDQVRQINAEKPQKSPSKTTQDILRPGDKRRVRTRSERRATIGAIHSQKDDEKKTHKDRDEFDLSFLTQRQRGRSRKSDFEDNYSPELRSDLKDIYSTAKTRKPRSKSLDTRAKRSRSRSRDAKTRSRSREPRKETQTENNLSKGKFPLIRQRGRSDTLPRPGRTERVGIKQRKTKPEKKVDIYLPPVDTGGQNQDVRSNREKSVQQIVNQVQQQVFPKRREKSVERTVNRREKSVERRVDRLDSLPIVSKRTRQADKLDTAPRSEKKVVIQEPNQEEKEIFKPKHKTKEKDRKEVTEKEEVQETKPDVVKTIHEPTTEDESIFDTKYEKKDTDREPKADEKWTVHEVEPVRTIPVHEPKVEKKDDKGLKKEEPKTVHFDDARQADEDQKKQPMAPIVVKAEEKIDRRENKMEEDVKEDKHDSVFLTQEDDDDDTLQIKETKIHSKQKDETKKQKIRDEPKEDDELETVFDVAQKVIKRLAADKKKEDTTDVPTSNEVKQGDSKRERKPRSRVVPGPSNKSENDTDHYSPERSRTLSVSNVRLESKSKEKSLLRDQSLERSRAAPEKKVTRQEPTVRGKADKKPTQQKTEKKNSQVERAKQGREKPQKTKGILKHKQEVSAPVEEKPVKDDLFDDGESSKAESLTGASKWKDLVQKYLREPSPKIGRTDDRSLMSLKLDDDDDDDDDDMSDIFERARRKYNLDVD